MRFPEFLKEHGTIGFVAPSFGCATEPYYTAFAHARERFGQMGYHTQMGPNCLVDKGIGISNDPALCGKELNESYCGTENDVIISCGGGELMCEVVPYIDFAGIAQAKPKWYMGFSDNTNFTFLSATIAVREIHMVIDNRTICNCLNRILRILYRGGLLKHLNDTFR